MLHDRTDMQLLTHVFATSVATMTTCALCLVVPELRLDVLQSNAAIASGQWWRLFTPAFLHGNLVHLAVNNFSLHNLGPMLETVSGRPRFLVVYAVSAVGGCVASYYGTTQVSVGASGK